MDKGTKGLILESLGGLYTVEDENGELLKLKARGIFRKDGFPPVLGTDASLMTALSAGSRSAKTALSVRPLLILMLWCSWCLPVNLHRI